MKSYEELVQLYGNDPVSVIGDEMVEVWFDEADVPEAFRPLIPYARFWGIGDDIYRDQLVYAAPSSALTDLVAAYEPYGDRLLYDWLGVERDEENGYECNEAYVAFTCLGMAADMAESVLEERANPRPPTTREVPPPSMSKDEALEFLRRHQPMPDDDKLDQETVDKFAKVADYFYDYPDPECVALLLGSFGNGDGRAFGNSDDERGVYWEAVYALKKQDRETVIRELMTSLRSSREPVRKWSLEVAKDFPDPALLDCIIPLLDDKNADIVGNSLAVLQSIGGPEARVAVEGYAQSCDDAELQEYAQDILNKWTERERRFGRGTSRIC